MDMRLRAYCSDLVNRKGEALFIVAGAPPIIKLEDGRMEELSNTRVRPEHVKDIARSMMSQDDFDELAVKHEMSMSISESGLGRFRANIFSQRNTFGIVMSRVRQSIPILQDKAVPKPLIDTILGSNGLVLFVNNRESRHLQMRLIDYRNSKRRGHIMTIENPIECLHVHRLSLVTQREIGTDVASYSSAIETIERFQPDFIYVDEIKTAEMLAKLSWLSHSGRVVMSSVSATSISSVLNVARGLLSDAAGGLNLIQEFISQLTMVVHVLPDGDLFALRIGAREKEVFIKGDLDALNANDLNYRVGAESS